METRTLLSDASGLYRRQPVTLRSDAGRPRCRLCGDVLCAPSRGPVECNCGWKIPEELRTLLDRAGR